MDPVTAYFLAMISIIVISKTITTQAKARKEAEILERNPEAWKKMKELEMEKKDRNRRAVGGAAFSIFRMFLGK